MSAEEEVLLGHKKSLEIYLRVDNIFNAPMGVNMQDTFVRQCKKSKWKNKRIWHMWLKAFVEHFFTQVIQSHIWL